MRKHPSPKSLGPIYFNFSGDISYFTRLLYQTKSLHFSHIFNNERIVTLKKLIKGHSSLDGAAEIVGEFLKNWDKRVTAGLSPPISPDNNTEINTIFVFLYRWV